MNMREAARRAGVSSATISRVLNGSPLVREETAQHVRKVLEELNFIPNPVATTLKYGRSRTYGLLIPDIVNPFYPEFLQHFEEMLVDTDRELLLATIGAREANLVKSVRRMLMRQVDGVVVMASELDTQAIEPLLAHRVPLVTIDRRTVEDGISDVAIDFEAGLLAAVTHLHALGHRRLAFVGGAPGRRTSVVRCNGFRSALAEHGLEQRPAYIVEGNYRVDGGESAVAQLLALRERPTAILTANDLTAFGVVRGLHRAGLHVPKDVSVVGLDDILLCDILEPPLTTVHVSRRAMAATCMEALEHAQDHPNQMGKRYSMAASLTVRASTAAPSRQRGHH